jgi:hypothetical protein
MKPWTRDNTKDWISQLENRIEDIDYYLSQTINWCESKEIYENEKVFGLCLITVLWVCYMRNEEITQKEIFEILSIESWEDVEEESIVKLGPIFENRDLEEILEAVSEKFNQNL